MAENQLSPKGPIFLLSGVPGVGKSTTARALMHRFERGVHVDVDEIRSRVVKGYASPVDGWTDETSLQFRLGFLAAAHQAMLYYDQGFAVVIDHVTYPEQVEVYRSVLQDRPLAKFLLWQTLDENLERNLTRTGKNFAAETLDGVIRQIHANLRTQIEVDPSWIIVEMGSKSTGEVVDEILVRVGDRA